MKNIKKAAVALLLWTAACLAPLSDAFAEEAAYTYTVTFYAGNQGTFADAAGLSVKGGAGVIQTEADRITITGLKNGDIVSFDVQAGAIAMPQQGKYYIRGVRESGRDNNTTTASAFKVSGDMDYVVAYGIRGDTVSYRVRYQDTAGNALAADRTYYGNVGDKAVAAYLYMEGYTPQALSVAKTLSADETENVLTFVYVKEETENGAPPSESADAPSAENENALQQTTNGGEENGAAGAEDAPQEAGQENAPAEDGADVQEGNPDDGEQVSLPDEQVPLEQELLDLDDEETPKANILLDEEDLERSMPLMLRGGTGVAAASALLVLFLVLMRRRKKMRAEEIMRKGDEKEH